MINDLLGNTWMFSPNKIGCSANPTLHGKFHITYQKDRVLFSLLYFYVLNEETRARFEERSSNNYISL
jgi:hypothetical protein